MVQVNCTDPSWMKSDTFYPSGTVCYRDPSSNSCPDFGDSGLGIMRSWRTLNEPDRYSWDGTLSMYKGCDRKRVIYGLIFHAGENPSVFTDGYCFLPWIAEQYNMTMPDDFVMKPSCSKSHGDKQSKFANFPNNFSVTYRHIKYVAMSHSDKHSNGEFIFKNVA